MLRRVGSFFKLVFLSQVIFFGTSLSVPSTTRAMPGDGQGLGVGVMLGEPTGLSLKKWLMPSETSSSQFLHAIDSGVGASFARESGLSLHADFLWIKKALFQIHDEHFDLHFGPGLRSKFGERDFRFGARAVGGLDYVFDDAPVEIFIEVVPILDVLPDTDISFQAAVGARFYF